MDFYSSSSGDFHEQAFNQFMSAMDSSDEEKALGSRKKKAPAKKTNPSIAQRPKTSDVASFQPMDMEDPYSFNMDFSKISAPNKPGPIKKANAKKQESKTVHFDDKPKTAQPKSTSEFAKQQAAFRSSLAMGIDSDTDSLSDSSSVQYGSKPVAPKANLMNWSEARKDYGDLLSEDSQSLSLGSVIPQAKKETYADLLSDESASLSSVMPSMPINLANKMKEPEPKTLTPVLEKKDSADSSLHRPDLKPKPFDSSISQSESSAEKSIQGAKFNSPPTSFQIPSYTAGIESPSSDGSSISEDYDDDASQSLRADQLEILNKSKDKEIEKIHTKLQKIENKVLQESQTESEVYTMSYDESKASAAEKKPSPIQTETKLEDLRASATSDKTAAQTTIKQPVLSETPPIKLQPAVAPPKDLNISQESVASKERVGKDSALKEFQLEAQIRELNQRLAKSEAELEAKENLLKDNEKLQVRNKFSQIEESAMENLKVQLREAQHKIELYKIETEELINQVDQAEGRVKDLEMENARLKGEVEKKGAGFDERLRISQQRAEERALADATRQFSIEREELVAQTTTVNDDLEHFKTMNTRLDTENVELRKRLLAKNDNSQRIEQLEREKFSLEVKLKEVAELNPGVAVLPTQPQAAQSQANKIDLAAEQDVGKLKRELEIQEQLIVGYQKENEKLVGEARALRAEVKGEHNRMMAESRRVEQLRNNLIREHGGILLKENISDIEGIHSLAGGTVIPAQAHEDLKARCLLLTQQITDKEMLWQEREKELTENIARLQRPASNVQTKAPLEIENLKTQFESEKAELAAKHKNEIAQIQEKLQFYVQNSAKNEVLEVETKIKANEINSIKDVQVKDKEIGILRERILELESQAVGKENAPQVRIKELQQQLEDTKAYYMKQMAVVAAKKMPASKAGEEVQRLQTLLTEKDKEISTLRAAGGKGLKQQQIKKRISPDLEDIPERDELDFDRDEPVLDKSDKFKTIRKSNDQRSTTMNVGPKVAWGDPATTAEVKAPPAKQEPALPGISPVELSRAQAKADDLSQQLLAKQTMFEQQATKFADELSKRDKDVEGLQMQIKAQNEQIGRLSIVPGTAEFLQLQMKIESIENSHMRREQELKNYLSSSTMHKDQEISKLKKEQEGYIVTIQGKNREIEQFRNELSEFLGEMDKMRKFKR